MTIGQSIDYPPVIPYRKTLRAASSAGSRAPEAATTDHMQDFVKRYPDAAMVTMRADGRAHTARIEIAFVDGRLWSSGSPELVRTKNVRRDPRSSLFVFGPHPHWLGLETDVALLEGDQSAALHIELMRARHGTDASDGMIIAHDSALDRDRRFTEDEYVAHIRADRRLIYEFTVRRSYGNF